MKTVWRYLHNWMSYTLLYPVLSDAFLMNKSALLKLPQNSNENLTLTNLLPLLSAPGSKPNGSEGGSPTGESGVEE